MCKPDRFVFGNGQPNGGWERDVVCALKAVRVWRTRFDDETTVSKGLVETYKSIAKHRELHAASTREIGMVAFAVFGFMQ